MANWFEVQARRTTQAEARAHFARPTTEVDARATGHWSCWLPSTTDRDEVIARHGNPEIAAIPLMVRNEISF